MYNSYFGLKENPFNLTPDPRYLFLSRNHKEALDHLLYGINERKGFITVTGGIGTGKTTLCRALLGHLDPSTKSALIFNAFISDLELLKTINEEFDIDPGPLADSKKAYIDALNDFLLKTFREGGNAVLLIDEAQNLSPAVLEQIRMLSNLETEKEKLIQIVLVGQTELKDVLASPSLRQLYDRIMVRYELKPLDPRDIRGYVEHRLVVAGARGDLRFSRGAFKKIYAQSQGFPRRINAICDRALLIAYTQEQSAISKAVIVKAIEELFEGVRAVPTANPWSWKRIVSFTVMVFLLLTFARVAVWQYLDGILGHFSSEPINIVSEIEPPEQVSPHDASLAKAPLADAPLANETLEAEPTQGAPSAKETPEAAPPQEAPATKPADLFLDEKTSLAGLFDLFNTRVKTRIQGMGLSQLSLVSFDVAPEYYVLLKKPFRIKGQDPSRTDETMPRYLLIREVKGDRAVAVDAGGNERTVSRDFLLNHWGRTLSWVYPQKASDGSLVRGMVTPGVLQVQDTLNRLGYLVEPTGSYDERTASAVRKFQADFGLEPDGIVGPNTRALLFQMTH